MRDETQFALLKLTGHGNAVNFEEFVAQTRQPKFAQIILNGLIDSGLVSISDGFLRMNMSQRMMIAERMIHEGQNPTKVSRFLEWQEFEGFTNTVLNENGFQTIKHFVFKTAAGRREIDVLSWNDTFILAIDCKHWLRGLTGRRIELVAEAQTERVRALAKRPERLARAKIGNVSERSIIPMILTLCNASIGIVNGVPIVPVSSLVNFLYGISPIDDSILRVAIETHAMQSRLL
jgi:hypothetical protein